MSPTSDDPRQFISAKHIWDQELVFPGQVDDTLPSPDPSDGEAFESYEEDHSTLAIFATRLDGMEWDDQGNGSEDPEAVHQRWATANLLPLWKAVVGPTGTMVLNKSFEVFPGLWISKPGGGLLVHFGKTIDGVDKYAISMGPQDRRYVLHVSFDPLED